MTQSPEGAGAAPECYRHPGRETWIRCQRCERPICPDCMRQASVGFQCPTCVKEGARSTRAGTLPYGGSVPGNPHQTTIGLIVANVLVWLAVLADGGSNGRLFQVLSLLPRGRCDTADLGGFYPAIHGAALCHTQNGHWFPGVADGAGWQVITSVFTHAEPLHIGFNMLALWFLGPPLEMVLGRTRFLAVYLISGLFGSAAVMLWSSPTTLTEGASGAIFGVMGALIVVGLKIKAPVQQLWIWLALNLVFTFTAANISWQGHLGGLLGGAIVAAVIVYPPRSIRLPAQAVGTIGLAVVALALIAVRAVSLTS
ncbi:rhomboid family intramembrane serine protease [Nocardioides terrisoli]|uniref:rhomboid family intramembrane serine protease n=1 Tax=Nocardioides terrisoli TaxID=3388267 RepID=UPI00287B6C3E|nr:rhomboid family intramembrane serine protease [Nocardioides marmorisolisilvae]